MKKTCISLSNFLQFKSAGFAKTIINTIMEDKNDNN